MTRLLSNAEINQRLHKFNLTGDWSVFYDVPPLQQVCVMYPHVSRALVEVDGKWTMENDELYKARLNEMFGPLGEENAVA